MPTRTPGIPLGRFGRTVARGSGLKGYVTWTIPPSFLADEVEAKGEKLIKRIDSIMTQGQHIVQERARALAHESYWFPSQPPRAEPGLTASKESPGGFAGARGAKGTFRIFLFHGSRTRSDKGYYYGRVLENEGYGSVKFSHHTEVIMPTINQMGPIIMGRFLKILQE